MLTGYLARRLLSAVVVMLLVLIALALLVRLIPGDPLAAGGGMSLGGGSPEMTARLRAEMGVDDPVATQVVKFASGVLRGDLGTNIVSLRPVTGELLAVLPHTLILGFSALIISFFVGSLLGVVASANAGRAVDRFLSVVAVAAWTIPAYLGALILLLIFVVWLGVAPSLGIGEPGNVGAYVRHLYLPVFALATPWIGLIARMLRANMLDVVNEKYLITARAFGLSERKVFLKYALRNAAIPMIAFLALAVGSLLTGAIFVEVIFSRPGLGSLLVNSIQRRNFPVARGAIFVVVLIFVVVNLVADLIYRLIDPRVRVEQG